jgi:uncharacterized protein (TIGR02271 family)
MLDMETARRAQGMNVVDLSGDKIGSVDTIYVDDETEQPEFALVNTGLFGTSSSFVPLAEADVEGDALRVPYEKAKVKDAPRLDPEGHLDPSQEAELYRYYGLSGYDQGRTGHDEGRTGYDDGQTRETGTAGDAEGEGTTGRADYDRDEGTVGRDTSGPTTDDAMTLSEEELRVGKSRRETGKARLRKFIVSENVTETVPVERETVHIEREPITDANAGQAMSGSELSEEEHEVTLMEEDVVVDKQAVPKERIRLDKDVVTEQETVSADVRREEVEIEGADTDTDTDIDRDRR